jgi:hypothetical protein
MVRKLGVSIPDWIYNDVVENNPGSNKSEWIAELLVKGYQKKLEEVNSKKNKNVVNEILSRDYINLPNNNTAYVHN